MTSTQQYLSTLTEVQRAYLHFCFGQDIENIWLERLKMYIKDSFFTDSYEEVFEKALKVTTNNNWYRAVCVLTRDSDIYVISYAQRSNNLDITLNTNRKEVTNKSAHLRFNLTRVNFDGAYKKKALQRFKKMLDINRDFAIVTPGKWGTCDYSIYL